MKKLSKTVKEKYEPLGKTITMRYHFFKRLRERMRIKLTDQDYEHIISCIKNTKPCNICSIRYLHSQSLRLKVFELHFPDCVPVNVIYDCQRKELVTVLFQEDGIEINFYYDVFKNKISLKFDLGYNVPWRIIENQLLIPNETVKFENDIYEVISEGILFEKRFKLDKDTLVEIM